MLGIIAAMAIAPSALLEPGEKPESFPVRGIHLSAPARKDVEAFVSFIREALAKEGVGDFPPRPPRGGVNTLILEFNFSFDFRSLSEFADPSAPGKDDVAKIARACKEAGIELIPGINCLGHQSWKGRNGAFLQKHPEFDETPGKYPRTRISTAGATARSIPGCTRCCFRSSTSLPGPARPRLFTWGWTRSSSSPIPTAPAAAARTPPSSSPAR
jgi:hypothetical protein